MPCYESYEFPCTRPPVELQNGANFLRAMLQNALRLFMPRPQCSSGHKKNCLLLQNFRSFVEMPLNFSKALNSNGKLLPR